MANFEFPLLSDSNRKKLLQDLVSRNYDCPYTSMRWTQKDSESLVIRDGLGDEDIKVIFKWLIVSSGDIDDNTTPNTQVMINRKSSNGSFRHAHGTEFKNYLNVEIVDQENKDNYIYHLKNIIKQFLATYYQTTFEPLYQKL